MDIQVFFQQQRPTPTQYLTTINGKRLWVKRDDLNDAQIQGNKLRKLKHLLLKATSEKRDLLSFGGAYSNHIAALATAGKRFGIRTAGIIRGDELANRSRQSHTLRMAQFYGMQLYFVSRAEYRQKSNGKTVAELLVENPSYWLIPEGGSHPLSLVGCGAIVDEILNDARAPNPDVFFCACGTGATFAGVLQGARKYKMTQTHYIGVPVLKGANFLHEDIKQLTPHANQLSWQLLLSAHEGGYGKNTPALTMFIKTFEQQFGVLLDPVYTGKLFKAVFAMAEQGDGAAEDWLIYHSGGLQGRL